LSARSSSSAVVPAISPIAPTLAMTPAVLARLVHVEGVVSVLERRLPVTAPSGEAEDSH